MYNTCLFILHLYHSLVFVSVDSHPSPWPSTWYWVIILTYNFWFLHCAGVFHIPLNILSFVLGHVSYLETVLSFLSLLFKLRWDGTRTASNPGLIWPSVEVITFWAVFAYTVSPPWPLGTWSTLWVLCELIFYLLFLSGFSFLAVGTFFTRKHWCLAEGPRKASIALSSAVVFLPNFALAPLNSLLREIPRLFL